ncbi:cytochrome c [Hyphomicrobium sp.]|uniref:c-type cytochrome n=1 Tax=Hyphomicrobium sp. TaxID=82 RepID=UPI002C20A9B5|nr:cytochrome c [Hyphomicrobium sp.]HRN88641.1 cytochrome c [Hyphomicrobium sp.]HRQ27757.1 cytochrome c [Hyphomicrobium sp.]
MKIILRAAAAAAITALLLGSALAAGPASTPKPDPENGRSVAERLCVGCHLIEQKSAGALPADVPSFAAIANKDGQTMEAIAGRIVIPHPPMPAIALSREEIRNVVAYIMTLRTAGAETP